MMGDSTSSMLYAVGIFLLLYFIGAGIYQAVLWVRRQLKKSADSKNNR
jgi:hypothetical protein